MIYEVDSIIDVNQPAVGNFRHLIDEMINISPGVPLSAVYDRPWDESTANNID